MTNKKILIIEDESTLLEAIERKLKIEGFQTITAMDGKEGMRKIETEKPDLILLDIMMPVMDGFEVLEEMKRKEYLPKIPVIIISNSGQPVEIEKALSLGVRDYLVKAEFSPDEVLNKVNNIIKKNSGAKEKNNGEKHSKKILVVEDDQLLLDLCCKKLQKEGFDVDIAIDGNTALEKIISNKPDLILLDLVLPGIDGFEILKKVREDSNDKIKKIPIIILSNLGQESDIEKGKKLGATDYFIKASVTTEEIVRKVKDLLIV
jgi:DNA-binding response OmpR family regulator